MEDKAMTLDSIMCEITDGFTGNAEKDLAYLHDQMERYKDHELGQEIVRACGRLMYDLLPDDTKERISQAADNDSAGLSSALEEVKFNMYKGNFEKALSIIEPLVESADQNPMYQDDYVSEYRVFDEFYEELLYRFIYKPEKTLRKAEYG